MATSAVHFPRAAVDEKFETGGLLLDLGKVAARKNLALVAGTQRGQRTFRVDRIDTATVTGHAATRPPGFNTRATASVMPTSRL